MHLTPFATSRRNPLCRALYQAAVLSCSAVPATHGSSEGHEMLKRNYKYHSIADDVPIPKM